MNRKECYMDRIEEFNHEGKRFIYFDLSRIRNNTEILSVIENAKVMIKKYPINSVYTITNLENLMFDSITKEITAEWISSNAKYVVSGAIIGVDGIKRMMLKPVWRLSKRTNMKVFMTRESAIEWLVTQ